MRIIIDSREQRPFGFDSYPVEAIRGTLPAGDYSVIAFEDRVAIERKSIDDLIGCLKGSGRERFERELARARRYELFCVCIEASMEDVQKHRYRSEMSPASVLQSLVTFQVRYGTSFIWCGSREVAELVCYSLLSKYVREIETRFKALSRSSTAPSSCPEVSPCPTVT
jgi:ERCC4-type nuclease